MFALMPDKTRASYDRMFGMLHDYCEEHELDTQWIGSMFMTDFEVFNLDVLSDVLSCCKTPGLLLPFLPENGILHEGSRAPNFE
jgi:hypothetical protein